MPGLMQKFLRSLVAISSIGNDQYKPPSPPENGNVGSLEDFTMAPDDPLVRYFIERPGVIEIEHVDIESEGLRKLKQMNVRLIAPLVSSGELVGLLNLGPRMSTQEYSQEDAYLLNNLTLQAAPALRIAQLAEQHKAEALERERYGQELRVARLIQQTLLPKTRPQLPGWQVSSYYQPARAVGGDFYDFLEYPDGRMAFVIGDVTDKGMPAALLMATTRATLRGAAQRFLSPGEILMQVNNILVPDTPESMFVTCLFAVLDPQSGRLVYANAGHNLPYRYLDGTVEELHATGMPLGLLPDMIYDEVETRIEPGEGLLLYSDGLVEARNVQKELFGNSRLAGILAKSSLKDQALLAALLTAMEQYTGKDIEQEDDVTLVGLRREMQGGMQ